MMVFKHVLFITLISVYHLSANPYPRGGGRGGGRGSSGRGGMHRGGGGESFSSSGMSIDTRYGDTFGYRGVPYNSYLYNGYYRDWDSLKSITSRLFYSPTVKDYNKENFYRRWDDENDRKWRETTRAPYFDNKIPLDDKVLPASAVIGAATAFGVVSLLPLDVPPTKPLMYCGNTDLYQSSIRINDQDIYVCNNKKIEILCRSTTHEKCVNEEVQCDRQNDSDVYCSENTLFSTKNLYCDKETTVKRKNSNDEISILNCHEGQLPRSKISFVPTSTTTEWPFLTTTPKPLSLSANIHITFLKLIGKSEALKSETTTPETFPYKDSLAWRPEALMVPQETTTMEPTRSTTRRPYIYVEKIYTYHDNGTVETTFRSIPERLQDDSYLFIMPPDWVKIYTTTEEPTTTTTTTEAPHIWMRKIFTNENEEKFEPVPNFMIDLANHFYLNMPSNWVKVPATEGLMHLINLNKDD